MRNAAILYTAVFLLLAQSALHAQIKAIYFGKLVDGRGKVITNAVVLTSAGRITAVGSGKDIAVPQGAEVIDMKAYTAIPGMIDAHTHITYYWDKAPGTNPWLQYGTLGPAVTVYLAQEN